MRSPIHLLRALRPTQVTVQTGPKVVTGKTRLDVCWEAVEKSLACRVGGGLTGLMFLGVGVDEMSSPIASLALGHFGSSCHGDIGCL